MTKKIFFIAGLPRSGSTLLCNLLWQNPKVFTTASSGTIDIIRSIRDICDKNQFFKAMPVDTRNKMKINIIKGALYNSFSITERSLCFDKNRGWPTLFELLSNIFENKKEIKAIICVRDLREILASFEKLYRKTSTISSTPQEQSRPLECRTALGRAKIVMDHKEPLGYSINVVQDALTRGWRNQMHFVDYNTLCYSPKTTLDGIYHFLEEEPFEQHDPLEVQQVTKEDDSIYGFVGLHDIKSKIEPQEPQWPVIFDSTVKETPFWGHITKTARFWER